MIIMNFSSHGQNYGDLAEPWKVGIATTIFVVVLPFVLFDIRRIPLGSTVAVLLGSLFMVVCQVLTQEDVYRVLGRRSSLQTIFLLLGMMLLGGYFEREKLLEKLLYNFGCRLPVVCCSTSNRQSFVRFLVRVCILSGILSAFFTNDATCIILTPLITKAWQDQKRSKVELKALLLGIATSANIGSVATIFGNPQLALIAAKTSEPGYEQSLLDLKTAFIYLLPLAVIGLVLNTALLIGWYKWCKWRLRNSQKMTMKHNEEDNERCFETSQEVQHIIQPLETEESRGEDDEDKGKWQDPNLMNEDNAIAQKVQADCEEICMLSKQEEDTQTVYDQTSDDRQGQQLSVPCTYLSPTCMPTDFLPSNSKPFHCFLFMMVITVVILLGLSTKQHFFDLGLIPIGAAVMTMCFDALLNNNSSTAVIKNIDWNTILLFFGMFVWLDGFNSSQLPSWFWRKLGLQGSQLQSLSDMTIFTFYVLVGSNIFSNVPLVILVLDQLKPNVDYLHLICLLAWVSTVAGNLTVFGSVANIIVIEKAKVSIGYRLSFWEYLKFGMPSAILITLLGSVVLFGLFKLY